MEKRINQAFAAMMNTLNAVEVVSPLLAAVRLDMEKRMSLPNRATRQQDFDVQTELGVGRPYVTLEEDPETGFVTVIDLHMVAPGDVTMAIDMMRQIQLQLASALNELANIGEPAMEEKGGGK